MPRRPLSAPPPRSVTDTVGYVRVSTDDQAADSRTSLADQLAAIVTLAARLGRTIGHVFEDPGASGATAEGRPGFMALLDYCRASARSAQGPGHVLVLNDSRWGRFRDPEEATYWRVELKRHGWLVRFVEGDETEDLLTRGVLRTIHSAQASAYREAIRANAKRGARGTAAQGFWQNEAPIGYRRQAEAPGRAPRILDLGQRKAADEKVRLVPGPAEEQQLVRSLFERYAMGTVSLASLVRELRQRPSPRRWATQSLAKLLTNPTYLGHVIWCRRPHDALERAERPVRPREEWVVAEHAHPALIPEQLFAEVQARLKQNRRELRRTVGGYALSGLLRCAHCGKPYIGAGGPKGPPDDPDRYRFYRCSGQKEAVWTCAGPSGILSRRLVEPAVIDAIGQIVADPTVQDVIAEEIARALHAAGDANAGQRGAFERTKRDLAAAHERVVDAIAQGTLTAGEAKAKLADIHRETDRVTAEIERLRFARRQVTVLEDERHRLAQLARDFPGLAKRLHGLELRELLRPWLHDAQVDLTRRCLTLWIKRVPAAGLFLVSSTQPARDSR